MQPSCPQLATVFYVSCNCLESCALFHCSGKYASCDIKMPELSINNCTAPVAGVSISHLKNLEPPRARPFSPRLRAQRPLSDTVSPLATVCLPYVAVSDAAFKSLKVRPSPRYVLCYIRSWVQGSGESSRRCVGPRLLWCSVSSRRSGMSSTLLHAGSLATLLVFLRVPPLFSRLLSGTGPAVVTMQPLVSFHTAPPCEYIVIVFRLLYDP